MTNPVLDALKETTILARVTTRALGLERTDNTASRKVIEDANAVEKAAKVKVNRLAGADALHKEIVSCQQEASAALRGVSQPFGEEDSWRMLPNANFEKFVCGFSPIKTRHDELVQKVSDNAEDICAKAQQSVGTLDVRMPTPEELRAAYSISVEFRPIPESANFRGLNENTINKLREMHDARLAAAVAAAERDTMERFVDPIERFIERMGAYNERMKKLANDPDSKSKTGIFKDTIVSNIQELAEVVDSFNISGDERLTELGNQVRAFANIEPKKLRESELLRNEATSRAQEIANNLRGWLGRT